MSVLTYCKHLRHSRSHLAPVLVQPHSTSSKVRSLFLDYFGNEDHVIIPSSPVMPPPSDKTLSFTNAGMNQFKGVFQGEARAEYRRAANSQKCVRVGGKHNDLSVVGTDSTHLTMFEMLGSWSFGDYWKRESCRLAWSLVTDVLRLDREKLWVTYFGGSDQLEPDLETRDIWLSLGVPESRLVGLGMSDNFWEMGVTGPCGPCTELHYSPTGSGGLENTTEIWNIVFIQYDRQVSGSLAPLSTAFVDTGMGLERITAVLDNSFTSTNVPDVFQTDLMVPLLEHISKMTGQTPYTARYSPDCVLDQGYRVLADHARMVTVCLADGMLPDDSHRLRNVLRRGQTVARNVFNTDKNVMRELSCRVVESLGDHFTNLPRNQERILTILDYEHENYSKLLERAMKFRKKINVEFPDIDISSIDIFDSHNYYESLKCVRKEAEQRTIEPKLAFKLYESHGMEEQDIQHFANITSHEFDSQEFQVYLSEQKNKSKYSSALSRSGGKLEMEPSVPLTEDQYKYSYERVGREEYLFPSLTSSLQLVLGGASSSRICAGERGALLTRHTNFYSEAGGQAGDRGVIRGETGTFQVEHTTKMAGYVVHSGQVTEGSLSQGDTVDLSIDAGARLGCMSHHTATHLLNSALNSLLSVTAQRSSTVTPHYLKFSFAVFNNVFEVGMVEEIEKNVQDKIRRAIPVKLSSIPSSQMEAVNNLITLPGELYPAQVRLVDVGDHVEPCCGTHLLNTEDLEDFVIVEVKVPSPGVRSVKCLTGAGAGEARRAGSVLQGEMERIKERINRQEDNSILSQLLADLQSRLSGQDIPFLVSEHLKSELVRYQNSVRTSLRASNKTMARDLITKSVREQESQPYFCQFIDASKADKISLSSALKSVPASKPAILLVRVGGEIKGKSVVPESLASEEFSAQRWLDVAKHQLGGKTSPPRGQNHLVNCNLMGGRAVTTDQIDRTLSDLNKFARDALIVSH